MYLGDYAEDETVYFKWDSFDSNGASITRATDGTISVYKDADLTQTTTGVTDTEDFDSLTGIHHVGIVTTDAFYTAGTDYSVVLSAATIDGQTVNAVLANFSIENRSALRPTVAGRTFDVAATGEGGVDFGNIAGTLDTANFAASFLTASLIATDAITNAKIAADAIGASELATDCIASDQLAATAITDIWAKVCESEGSYTAQQILSIALSVLAGETNTGGTVFRTPNDNATRVTATVDASDNRTAMTLTPSA